jgi:hypothetical protein
MSGTPWTDKETDLARQMIAAKAPDAEFRRVLGRPKALAYHRMYRTTFPRRASLYPLSTSPWRFPRPLGKKPTAAQMRRDR